MAWDISTTRYIPIPKQGIKIRDFQPTNEMVQDTTTGIIGR